MSTMESNLDALKAALEAEKPSPVHANRECVAAAFELIEAHLVRRVPMERVRELFNESQGLSISLARFRQLLRAEKAKRKVTGIDNPVEAKVKA